MEDWQYALDRYLTTPPDEPETNLYCVECDEGIYPDDAFYEIDGMRLCEDCAKAWLENQRKIATDDDCYE